MTKAICPGSFDPPTKGHIDIITRAAGLFDEVIAVVVVNPAKNPSFTAAERIDMLRKSTSHLPNLTVDSHHGLLVEYVKRVNAVAIVKGLRAMSDFEYEFQMALTNKKMYGGADTLFLTTAIDNMYLTSGLVKQVASYKGDISEFVPAECLGDIERRLSGRNPSE
ncbi:MAG: pantetheine-phosphate adenylyltransferase [Oscillospiraceae bacterium]|nr:pantetheine-phosphate adenylyltransferase [Oscillospiraceae bacterium]